MVPCATAPPPPPRYMKAAPAAAKLSRWALVIMADVSRWRVDRAGHVRTRVADHANSRRWNVRSRQTVVKPMSAARFASKLSTYAAQVMFARSAACSTSPRWGEVARAVARAGEGDRAYRKDPHPLTPPLSPTARGSAPSSLQRL